ncbi:MAG: hypothetical protein DMG28_10015 [Acidobacteria bacterium]|nr:MAG: hypothetical protein DMG28_10015 [Acidobacteriota bacterium]
MRAARDPKQIKAVEPHETKAEVLRDAPAQSPKTWDESSGRITREKPRGFPRVPTHVVGAVQERRLYPRAALRLPLRLKRVAGQREPVPVTLVTKNISSSGVYFLCPRWIEPGTPIELEVGLVDRPLGRGSVRMTTAAHIVRVEPADTPGWHGVAATFDDITFQRDEQVPPRFQKP